MQSTRILATAAASFALGIVVAIAYPSLRDRLAASQSTANAAQPAPAARPNPHELRFAPGAVQLDQIRTTPAVLSDVPLVEPLAARLAYDETRTTRVSSPIAGRIVELVAKPGDAVKAGQVLARIDSPDFGVAVSDVEKARADADRKDAALKRTKAMYEAGLAAKRDLEGAEADFEQARSESRRAEERLANLHGLRGSRAGRFDLVAPIAGIVVDRQANPGMEVRPDLQNPLFVVSDLRSLWALVDVPEQFLRFVTAGSPAAIEVAAYPGKSFPGKVDYLSPVLDPATRRVQARVAIDNADRLLRPEMYAKAIVSTSHGRKAVRVPVSALVSSGERSYAYVETADGVFQRRALELAAQNHEYAYAASGIDVGDQVVTTGALLLASEAGEGR